MSDDPSENKDEVIRLLSDIETDAKAVESVALRMAQDARFVCDVVVPLRMLYTNAPVDGQKPEHWAAQAQAIRLLHVRTHAILRENITPASSYTAIAGAATNTAVTGLTTMLGPLTGPTPIGVASPSVVEEVQQAKSELNQVLEQSSHVQETIQSLRRLGLDSCSPGGFSPIGHLEQSIQSLQLPVGEDSAPVAVLIQLRECINASIAELIRRRPEQEKANGWQAKIVSLGGQCALDDLPSDHFDRLGAETEEVIRKLSGAKSAHMDRKLIREYFDGGVRALNTLLESIDEEKLKPARQ